MIKMTVFRKKNLISKWKNTTKRKKKKKKITIFCKIKMFNALGRSKCIHMYVPSILRLSNICKLKKKMKGFMLLYMN